MTKRNLNFHVNGINNSEHSWKEPEDFPFIFHLLVIWWRHLSTKKWAWTDSIWITFERWYKLGLQLHIVQDMGIKTPWLINCLKAPSARYYLLWKNNWVKIFDRYLTYKHQCNENNNNNNNFIYLFLDRKTRISNNANKKRAHPIYIWGIEEAPQVLWYQRNKKATPGQQHKKEPVTGHSLGFL